LLLLRHARALVPAPRVILALDADEILAANALDTPSWRAMLDARLGPSCASSASTCTRHPTSACGMTG